METTKITHEKRLTNLLNDMRESVKASQDRLEQALARKGEILAEVKECQKLAKRNPFHFMLYYGALEVTIRVQCKNFKNDRTLTPLLSRILDGNWAPTDSADFVTAHCADRTFYFKRNNTILSVIASLTEDGVSCRKVVTGSTMQEVRTYEIACK